MKDSFVLVNLSDESTKDVAHTLQNKTCKRILSLLGDQELSESMIARHLNLPLSTVHYNIKLLERANLIIAEEFHYSPKGKEVLHYKLAQKFIIIAPKKTEGLQEKLQRSLKHILPVTFVAAAGAFFISLFTRTSNVLTSTQSNMEMAPAKQVVFDEVLQQTAPQLMTPALWFLLGALTIFITITIVRFIKKRT